MGKRRRIVLVVAALLLAATGAALFHLRAAGSGAPDFALNGLDGKVYTLGQLRGKKPVVLNFWASWCPPCQYEAPILVELYEKYRDKIEIYAIDLLVQDDLEDVKTFVEAYGYEFPVLLDKKGNVARQYRVVGIPTSYFIDKAGQIKYRLVGVTTPANLEKMFQSLIGPTDSNTK